MSSLKTALDSVYAYRFIRLMQKPFSEWEAYTLGIINDKGGLIKRPKTDSEKAVYTPFHAAVRSLKRVTSTVPGFNGVNSIFQAYSALSSRFGMTEADRAIIEKELGIQLNEEMVAGDAGGDSEKIASGSTSGSIQNVGGSVINKKSKDKNKTKKYRKNIVNLKKL